jgi:sugar-specific transcriptional regulator TrmB
MKGCFLIPASEKRKKIDDVERRVFTSLGLLEQEWNLYRILCKTGAQKATDLSRQLKVNRVLVYAHLKKLQKKGLVEATIGVPQMFLAVSPQKMMNLCIENMKDELRDMVKDRMTIISDLQFSNKTRFDTSEEKVAVIQGLGRIFSRVKRMVDECKSEFLWMVTIESGRRNKSLQMDSLERFIETISKKPNVSIKVIANLYPNASDIARIMEKAKNYDLKLEMRQTTFQNTLLPARFVVRDREEVLMSLSSRHKYVKKEEEKGLWTNNQALVETLIIFFDKIWNTSSQLA